MAHVESAPLGIKTLFAGRGMTLWDTFREAQDSWRAASAMDLLPRARTLFWRETQMEMVPCPPDVSVQDVLRKDL